MLRQVTWTPEAEAAFAAAYGNEGEVTTHREDVAAGRELLMDCGPHGWITLKLEPRGVAIITGAAGESGGFEPVLDALEAFFSCVCVETYREGLVRKLKARGYGVDCLRLFKHVVK